MYTETTTKTKTKDAEIFIAEVDEEYCAMKARELYYKRLAEEFEKQQKMQGI